MTVEGQGANEDRVSIPVSSYCCSSARLYISRLPYPIFARSFPIISRAVKCRNSTKTGSRQLTTQIQSSPQPMTSHLTKDTAPIDGDANLEASNHAPIDADLDFELELGIPQPSDPFIQKYFSSRAALIAQEKKQRHDYIWKQTMSPLARQAALIMSRIRKKELKTVWTSEFEESMTVDGEEGKPGDEGVPVYPGMMFTLARQRMETTKLWKIMERMPKGALLHAHLDAMIDVDWLIEQVMNEEGICVLAPKRLRADSLDDSESGRAGAMQCRFYPPAEIEKMKESEAGSIW